MKGTVLGFDGTTGAITGEDGGRYTFTASDWKGQRPAQPGDNADFVANGSAATEVYLTGGSRLVGLGSGIGGGGQGVGYIAERPQLILAALAILAAVLLPYIRIFIVSFTAIGFPSVANDAGGLGGGAVQALAVLAYTLWLIPLGAGFVIFRELTNARMPKAELAVGILCVWSLVYYLLLMAVAPRGTSSAVSFGFGGILLVLVGVGLILTGIGKFRRLPGL